MDTGNRIDNRARGNASQLHEKYRSLARDAQMQGDRVNTEYYLQFADHYFRVLSEQRGRNDEQQVRRQPRDSFDDGYDSDDYGDEGEQGRQNEQSRPQGQHGRDDRGQQTRDDQGRQARDDGRDRPSQDDESRDDPRADRSVRSERSARPDRPAYTDRSSGDEAVERRPRRERARPEEPIRAGAVSLAAQDEQSTEAPRRRGRPRRQPESASDVGAVLDADRLPPSLSVASSDDATKGNATDRATETDATANDATENDRTDDVPKPRRRRVRPATPEASAAE